MVKALAFLAASEAGGALRRRLLALGVWIAALVMALISLVFALLALRGWLAVRYGAFQAELMIAAGLLGVAVVLGVVAMLVKRRNPAQSSLASAALVAAPLAVGAMRKANLGVAGAALALILGAGLGRSLSRQ